MEATSFSTARDIIHNLADDFRQIEEKSQTAAVFPETFQALLQAPDNNLENNEAGGNPSEGIPSWVKPPYHYDVNNPRKPYFAEFLKAVSGLGVEEYHALDDENRVTLGLKIIEQLYSVSGSVNDTRDWSAIMNAPDIMRAAQDATFSMHKPVVDVETKRNEKEEVIAQNIVLRSSEGNILRQLPTERNNIKDALEAYGTNKKNLSQHFFSKIKSDFIPSDVTDYFRSS